MNEYEVNFLISGNYLITAASGEDAQKIVNGMINDKMDVLENSVLCTGLRDDDYTTDIIKV